MKLFRSMRWLLLALLLPLIPASRAHAGVFISVGFAPPILPVYAQPMCPDPGYMWTPGYWGYGPDGYYWVPGAWVPAPYEDALWTPPYWGYEGAVYVFHPGYWGPHVGYYGGVNYGFGFFGLGFVGGEWRGGVFAYNTAVMHVGVGPGWGGERVYVDRAVIADHTVARDSRVAYSGGPGGINHPPTAQERTFMHEQHAGATAAQREHVQVARADHASYFNANHGQPQRAAVDRPLGSGGRANTPARSGGFNGNAGGQYRPQQESRPQSEPRPQSRPQEAPRPESHPESHPQSKPSPKPSKDHDPRR